MFNFSGFMSRETFSIKPFPQKWLNEKVTTTRQIVFYMLAPV